MVHAKTAMMSMNDVEYLIVNARTPRAYAHAPVMTPNVTFASIDDTKSMLATHMIVMILTRFASTPSNSHFSSAQKK